MNILLVGDSWTADWTEKSKEFSGWPTLLSNQYNVTNLSKAGVSQYRICKQLEKENLENYDLIICSITSPNRLYSKYNLHKENNFHNECDLIFQDIESAIIEGNNSTELKTALNFFIEHWDKDYADFVHKLKVEWCYNKLTNYNTIYTSIINESKNFLPKEAKFLDGFEIFETYPGPINHLSEEGNTIFFNNLKELLKQSKYN